MTPIITVTAIPAEIQLATDDIHPELLRSELHAHKALGPDKVHGVSHTAGNARVHVPTTVDPKLAEDIAAALQGFEKRIGGAETRKAILADLRAKYDPEYVDMIEHEPAVAAMHISHMVAEHVGTTTPGTDEWFARVQAAAANDKIVNAKKALNEFHDRQNTSGIREKMLKELQDKFPQVDNLALFTPTDGSPDYQAHVTVKGDVAPETISAIHEVAKAHDKSKAPSPVPDDNVVLISTINAMNEQMKGMLKEIEALKEQVAKISKGTKA